MEERFFGVKKSSLEEMQHMLLRSILLGFLTVMGFAVLDRLVDSGIADRFSLVHRFPEFIMMMSAAAKFTFIEMSLYWIRFGTQVRNEKEALNIANNSPMSAAFVHFTNSLLFIARLAVFLYLMNA